MRILLCLLRFGSLLLLAGSLSAQNLLIYDDALRNGFVDGYSYGGGTDLLSTVNTHNGSAFAIAFTGNNANALALPNESVDFSTAQYVGVRFYVHGGASGAQQLRFQLYTDLGGVPVANVELDSYITGGSIAANQWRLVEVRFANPPLAFAGSFDRIDLQSDAPGTQPTLYIDDVSLLNAATSGDSIFRDGMEDAAAAGQLRFINTPANLMPSVNEGVGSVSFQVERLNGSAGAVSVDLQIAAGGSASSPADYILSTPTANWADGETGIKNLLVSIVDDLSVEPIETANLQLGNALGGVSIVAPSAAILTINDNDAPPPTFSINDVGHNEGNAGSTPYSFSVTRGGGLAGTDTVQAQTANGSAVAPTDYTAVGPLTLTFNPGVTSQSVTVSVNGDTDFEADENFLVNLSNPSAGSLSDSQGLGTIVNDDAAPNPGQLRFSATAYSVGEAEGMVTISVQRINGSGGAASVNYATSDGSAVAPGDYGSASGTLNWAAGDASTKTFSVNVVADALPENDETIGLSLSNPTGASLGVPSTAVLTIVEPEYLLVPQYTGNAIKLYQRGAAGFALLRSAPLGAGVLPNALAFAADGKLWVVDNGAANKRLLRYSQSSLLMDANPQPEVVIGQVGGNAGDIFDLAFFDSNAFVTQSNFGATHRVLKYPLSSLNVSGNPLATVLSAASLNIPAGLEFDAQGRLWIGNFGNNTLVRMNTTNASVDRIATSVAVGARNSLNLPEGLAFDRLGSLWVGNNGEPTVSAYAQWQLEDAGLGATAPVHQIDINPALFAGDTVGGLAFDRDGDLWANYQKTLSVLEYSLISGPRPGGLPGVGSYQSAAGQVLPTATTFPGFGGIALWPIPASTHLQSAGFKGTNVVGMEMHYLAYPQATGPIGGTHYPVHDTRLIDYFAGKGMTTIRFLFSWEAMQSTLMGPIPAAASGDYKLYFDRYKNIVDYATNVKGMQVIVEPWQSDSGGGAGGPRWRGNLVGSGAVPTAAWSDFWTKMAGIYAANPKVSFGLINEPNNMSTLGWWAIAQAGITAIRSSGATQPIYVPGNGYSAASTWVIGNAFYDTDPIKRSNAYGWLNANGVGMPINDPLNNIIAEVHTYLDVDQGGSSTVITSVTAAREHLQVVVTEARAQGYKVYLGEMGFLATVAGAPAAWADFIAYYQANQDVLVGFTWWAGGAPGWWDDIGANGGGHFAITPTNGANFTGDTVNMDMIENDF